MTCISRKGEKCIWGCMALMEAAEGVPLPIRPHHRIGDRSSTRLDRFFGFVLVFFFFFFFLMTLFVSRRRTIRGLGNGKTCRFHLIGIWCISTLLGCKASASVKGVKNGLCIPGLAMRHCHVFATSRTRCAHRASDGRENNDEVRTTKHGRRWKEEYLFLLFNTVPFFTMMKCNWAQATTACFSYFLLFLIVDLELGDMLCFLVILLSLHATTMMTCVALLLLFLRYHLLNFVIL
ncbi:hypothetical protein B0H67DRAFT_45299 [Lasiosphaeris hirsuta]|uniref:Uncharacterized protein n=1 Tax=Lasiosphaeris hirsuta TaxID=260670 RepID=A0AA40BAY4_9PEZI|nr:hypothetical protein B0H67DRAFT_45299 [Lasiosphaeris hirsuta]